VPRCRGGGSLIARWQPARASRARKLRQLTAGKTTQISTEMTTPTGQVGFGTSEASRQAFVRHHGRSPPVRGHGKVLADGQV
jgi:hypothetical protein